MTTRDDRHAMWTPRIACQGPGVIIGGEHTRSPGSGPAGTLSAVRSVELESARHHLFGGGQAEALVLRGDLGSGRTVLLSRLVGSARSAGFDVRHLPSLSLDARTEDELSAVSSPTLYVYDDGLLPPRTRRHMDGPTALRWAVAASATPHVRVAFAADEPALTSVAAVLDVDPVSESTAFAFVSSRAPWAAPTSVDRVVELAEGNLALLVQGAHDLRDGGDTAAGVLPRIRLPEQYSALTALFLGATAVTQQVLAAAAVRRGDIALDDTDDLVLVLMRPVGGGRLRFRSPVHRAAVLEGCDADLLRRAHALAVEDAATADEHRASHRARAQDDHGASLAQWAWGATYASASEVVHAHLTSANLCAHRDQEESGSRHGRALSTAALAGDLILAEQLITDERTDLRRDPESMIGAAIARALVHGDLQGARSLALRALAVTADDVSAERALVALAVINVLAHDVEAWRRWHQLASHSTSSRVHRLAAAVSEAVAGSRDVAPVDLERPTAARTVIDDVTQGLLAAVLPEHSWETAAGVVARRPGNRLASALTDCVHAGQLLRASRWVEALEVTGRAGQLALAGGARSIALGAQAIGAMGLALSGDAQQARATALDVLSDPVTGRCERIAVSARHALLHVALQLDDADAVLASVTESDNRAFDGGACPGVWMLDLADGLEHPEVPQDLRAARHQLISPAVRRRDPGERISFDYLRAMGQDHGRLITLRKLIASTRGSAHRFESARVRLGYGRLLLDAGELPESSQVLTTAATMFDALGTPGWAAVAYRYRSVADARRDGAEGSEISDLELPLVDVPLTEQEAKVAMLAAAGLSNKQIGERLFLSPRTVGGHLYNIFPKLGVRSRAGLRDALNRSHNGRSRSAS